MPVISLGQRIQRILMRTEHLGLSDMDEEQQRRVLSAYTYDSEIIDGIINKIKEHENAASSSSSSETGK